jgi:long-chain acyl-CoA synthetase
MRNLPELVIAYVAATSMAAVIVPLNGWWTGQVRVCWCNVLDFMNRPREIRVVWCIRLQSQELEYALQDCGATVFIADQERYNRAKPYLSKLRLDGRTILVRESDHVLL